MKIKAKRGLNASLFFAVRSAFLCLLLVELVSCSDQKKHGPFVKVLSLLRKEVASAPGNIEIKTPTVIPFSTEKRHMLVSELRFFKLGDPSTVLIGSIDKFLRFEDRWYFLDKKSHSVHVFEKEGNFLYTISRVGKGPGEYLKLTDFSLDRDRRRIILYSNSSRKVIQCNLKGDFITEFRSPYWAREFFFQDPNTYCFLTLGKNFTGSQLITTDSLGKAKRKALSIQKPHPLNVSPGGSSLILPFRSGYQFSMPFSTSIYQYFGDTVICKYRLDLGEHEIKFDAGHHKDIDGFIKATKESGKSFCTGAFFETSRYVGFEMLSTSGYTLLYDKENRISCNFSKWILKDNKLATPLPLALEGDKLYSVIPASWLIEHKLSLIDQYEMGNLYDDFDNMSNPVLISFSLVL